MVTWTLLTDTDDDGLFDDADILTADIYAVEIHYGLTGTSNRMAEGGTAIVRCKNTTGKFYLESGSPHALRTGRWLQLKATATPTTYTVFTGVLRRIRRIDRNMIELTLETRFHGLSQTVDVPMFEDTLISAIVTYLLRPNVLQLVHPVNKSTTGTEFAYINFVSINACYIFASLPPLVTIDTAKSTLPFYGGIVDGSRTGRQHLENLVAAEWGWLYEDRDGTIRFRNRHTTIIDATVQRTFTDADMADFEYDYGEDVISKVEATVIPRLRESRIVWTADAPRRIEDGITFQTVRFINDDGRVLGLAADAIPILDFDFENADGTARTDVTVHVDKIFDNGIQLRFGYPGGGARYISAGSTITAMALIQQDAVDIVAEVGAQQTFKRTRTISGLETTDVDYAAGIVNFVLQENTEAHGEMTGIKLEILGAAAFDLDILDLIRVNSAQTGHNQLYRVIGWDYDWEAGAGTVTYRLRPDAVKNYIVISVSGRNMINSGSIAH